MRDSNQPEIGRVFRLKLALDVAVGRAKPTTTSPAAPKPSEGSAGEEIGKRPAPPSSQPKESDQAEPSDTAAATPNETFDAEFYGGFDDLDL